MAATLSSNLTFISTTTLRSNSPASRSFTPVRCGGPRSNRGPLLKGRILSTEAIQAIQALKRAQRSSSESNVSSTISRLLKPDLIAAFKELLRQEHCDLALKLFSVLKHEFESPELSLYADLATALAAKGLSEEIDRLICDLENEGSIRIDGSNSNSKAMIRLVKALIAAGRVESIVRVYELMKRSGAEIDDYLGRVLSRGLRGFGMEEEADEIDVKLHSFSQGGLDEQKV